MLIYYVALSCYTLITVNLLHVIKITSPMCLTGFSIFPCILAFFLNCIMRHVSVIVYFLKLSYVSCFTYCVFFKTVLCVMFHLLCIFLNCIMCYVSVIVYFFKLSYASCFSYRVFFKTVLCVMFQLSCIF